MDPARIGVIGHPHSSSHARVGFSDGGLMGQIGPADMRDAIV